MSTFGAMLVIFFRFNSFRLYLNVKRNVLFQRICYTKLNIGLVNTYNRLLTWVDSFTSFKTSVFYLFSVLVVADDPLNGTTFML